MSGWRKSLIIGLAAAASGFAQFDAPVPPVPPVAPMAPVPPMPPAPTADIAPFDYSDAMSMARAKIASLNNGGFQKDLTSMLAQSDMLFAQARGIRGKRGGDDAAYDEGTRALDEHKYDEAIRRFDSVINNKSPRADGALYWKAYALNRAGRRDDALASIAALRRDYPGSRWLNDAQALEA
jgi:TolA-binding protein